MGNVTDDNLSTQGAAMPEAVIVAA
ncbi:MAG: hypothetical protein V7633_2751, partial [Pseudonocardia sp.]